MLKSTPHRREPSTDKYSVQKGGQCWNCTSNKRVASAVLKSTPHRREPSTDKYSIQKGGQCWNCTSNKMVASAELYRMKASALLHSIMEVKGLQLISAYR